MPLELYLDLHSQPCRSVFIFAKINKIPFEYKAVDLSAGEQYGDEFGKVSIIRKVPALKDGDFLLTESIAILLYLAGKHSTPDHWYPADLQKRAQVDEFLSWQHTNIRSHGSKVFWFKGVLPAVTGAPVPKEKMDSALEDLNMSLKIFEDKFLQSRPFIIGDKISLADIVAIVEMMQPVATGVDVFEGRPALSAWRDRVKKEVGVELFDEAHKVIMNVESLPQTFENKGLPEFFKLKIQKMFN
ncbi:glutathione S-transferase theta-1a [Danio rerio]|uniref:glutathione transferase n=1 Tax=Danio rerio TaxID=7955 RepID=E7EZ94_DANRE|nr:glutathione S-transferase theta-1a [Danio rerio]|eukprot:NP_001314691.1 glutathione S-transferase theta 1a [Danio rerio]